MKRLFEAATLTVVAVCAALPTPALAQEFTDYASARTEWDKIKKKLRRKGFEFDLEQFATSAADLVEQGVAGPELEKMLRDEVCKELRPVFTKKKKITDGSCLAAVCAMCLALADEPSIDLLLDALEPYQDWEDLNRPAYRELSALLRAGTLTPKQTAALQARTEGVIKDAPRQMRFVFEAVRALTGDAAADRSEWGVKLIAGDAFDKAKKLARQDSGLLEEVAKMLGELWGTQPYLAQRVDVLLQLGRMGSPIDGLARDGLRRITFQNFGLDGEPAHEIVKFKNWWKDCEKATGANPSDGAIIAFSLDGRRAIAEEKGQEAELQVDVIRLLGRWNSPRFGWATPTLVSLFQWNPNKFGELRTNVVLSLRRIRDPRAAEALLGLLNAVNPDNTPKLDKSSEAAVIRTLGFLADKATPGLVDRLRQSLRRTNEEVGVRRAAAEALGRLQVHEAIDELLAFAAEATSQARRDALVAVARLGTEDAGARLLALWTDTSDDERANLIHAYGRFAKLPLPDAMANLLLVTWGTVDGLAKKTLQQAYKDELIQALLGGLAEADPDAEPGKQKRYRGVAHPKFLELLRSVALDTDVKNKDRAKQVIEALAEVKDLDSVADVMFLAVTHDDPERRSVSRNWVRDNVRREFRDYYVDMLNAKDMDLRVIGAGLLVKPVAWDAASVFPRFIELLRTDGPKGQEDDATAKLIRTIMDGIRERPAKQFVPQLFGLMEDREGAWLNMQLHGVLFGWMTNSNAQQWALALRASRKMWEQFWKKHGDKVTLIGDELEKGE